MPWLRDFLAKNKDAIDTLLRILGIISIPLLGGIGWLIRRWWKNRLRVDLEVFEVITDPTALLPKLYSTENDDSLLADHRVTYQPRDSNFDTQAELKSALNRSRYLLITGPTGYGKTREAGVLAQTMMLEGWRVLRIKTGWLDVPKTLPEELNGNRSRVLIFLDDLNGLFSTGELTQSPRAEQMPLLGQAPYHDRLLQMLDTLEGMCTKKEIRVIATARSEADQWNLLNFDPKDRLWRRFERIELPGPTDITIINLLDDSTKQVDLKANSEDFAAIAHKSDGTYRNILLNLRRWLAQSKEVNKDDFTETLDGSWRDIYERAVKQHPAVQYIYDAVDILQQAGILLMPTLVEPIAIVAWGGNVFQKFAHSIQIQFALDYLTQETKILRKAEGIFTPSDGQIEAKNVKVDWSRFIFDIERSILHLRKIHISNMNLLVSYLLFQLGFTCLLTGSNEHAIRIWQKISSDDLYDRLRDMMAVGLKVYPGAEDLIHHAFEQNYRSSNLYFVQGLLLEVVGRVAEAEGVYRQIIAKDPHDAYAHTKLGDVLRKLKRYLEAEEAYHQSIANDTNYAHAYCRLGSLLRTLERYTEAEAAYRKAIAKDPNDVFTYWRFGALLMMLERYVEAEAIYRQAIMNGHGDVYIPYINSDLGNVLGKLGRYAEAEAACRTAIELDESEADAYSNLGNILKDLNRFEEAEPAYRKAIELNPSDRAAYNNLGIMLRKLKRYDDAETVYRKAIENGLAHPYLFSALGLVLRLEGKLLESLDFFTKSQEAMPGLSSVLNLAGVNKQLKNQEKTIENITKAREIIEHDDWYNLACLESISDNIEPAFEYLKLARDKEGFDVKWSWKDPDLQWIRDDPRFIEIVGPNPEK